MIPSAILKAACATVGALALMAPTVVATEQSAQAPAVVFSFPHGWADAVLAIHGAAYAPLVLEAGGAEVALERDDILGALSLALVGGSVTPRVLPEAPMTVAQSVAAVANRDGQLRVLRGDEVLDEGGQGFRVDRDAASAAIEAELTARLEGTSADLIELPGRWVTPATYRSRGESLEGPAHVHLTFDDGPGFHTEAILDVLAEYGVLATFYVVGELVEEHPETVRRILEEGHTLGNHSFSHPVLPGLSRQQIFEELSRTQDAIEAATGYRPSAFRPPYGAVNSTVRSVAAELGLSVDLWTVDPQDWRSTATSASIYADVVAYARVGSNVLLHVQHERTLHALPAIIDTLRAMGLTL